jgi:hypothetical protein
MATPLSLTEQQQQQQQQQQQDTTHVRSEEQRTLR